MPKSETRDPDLATIRQRWYDSLIPPKPQDRNAILAAALPHLQSLRPEGVWPDVAYQDTGRSAWGPGEHAARINLLARASAVVPEGTQRKALQEAAVRALGWWVAHDPQCPNWWWNQIGIGEYLSEVLLFLGSAVPAASAAYVTGTVLPRSQHPGTGANLVWFCENLIAMGVLTQQPDVVADAYRRIYNEIRIVPITAEGIQADRSLHQHGAQFYSGGYGFFFGNDCARFTAFAWGTRYQIPPDRMQILASYLLDAQQWMIRGDTFDYSAIGRELTRKGRVAVPRSWVIGPISPPGAAYGLPQAAELLGDLPVPRRGEFAQLAKRLWQGDTLKPTGEVTGNRHYWCSDYMAHRREGYLLSVRMYSKRLQNTEIVNGEGTRSHHLADGAMLLYRVGDEYRDIFPLWDWRKIPGTTAEQGDPALRDMGGIARHGVTDFVGGVSDGMYGLAVFDFVRSGLKARKAWFCFEEATACLGAGITCESDLPVATTVNQCWSRGNVASGSGWLHHNGVGYRFLAGYPAGKAVVERRSGRWSDLGAGSKATVQGDVFQIAIDHGVRPSGERSGYAYVVLPGVDPKVLQATADQVRVVANTHQVQAAYHTASGVLLAAFYEPGKAVTSETSDGLTVAVDKPCALSLRTVQGRMLRLAVSNPRNQPLQVRLTVNRSVDGAGASVGADGTTTITLDLPTGGDAGRSLVGDYRLAAPRR